MSTKIPGMVHQGLLAPQGLNIFGQMDRISPNFVNAFIFTRSRLGLLPSIFCLLYPRYEVYRGYIVFAFSVIMFVGLSVCLSVNFFSVKVFSATTWVRILKFCTKLDSDELYCVTKEQPHIAYQSLYLFIFLSLQWKFLSQISQLLLEPVFSNFVYTFRMTKCTV